MRLSLAAGPLPRLVAAGVPDWIGADGSRIGWSVRDIVFWLDGDHIVSHQLPDFVDDVCATPHAWTCATAGGAVVVEPAADRSGHSLVVDEGAPLGVLPGADCVLVLSVPEHSLVRLADGVSVDIPDAATRARFVAPFATGVGLLWIDLEMLFRLTDGGIPQALGRVSGASALAVGPAGAALVSVAEDTVCAAPRSPPVRLGQGVQALTARFSPDGRRALVADEDGVLEVDLGEGKVLRRWDGPLTPVGYAPRAVRWNRSSGALLDDADQQLVGGFVCTLVTMFDGKVVRVDSTEVRVGGARFVHDLIEGDDEMDVVVADAEGLVLQTLDGAAAAFTWDGLERWRERGREVITPPASVPAGVVLAADDEPSSVGFEGAHWALPADRALRAGNELWISTEEGMVVALPG
ncbi:MAG: hypothetical protein EXR71_04415 [Myxococcales bacterium]|nr:hypothetical protein [Myxococcales bacterium]